jgi:hypothetical protein
MLKFSIGGHMKHILIAALKEIIAKIELSTDALQWLEGWIGDVKEKPSNEIIQEFETQQAKPKRPMTLYRGFNQGKYKSLDAMMKKEFGKVYEEGDSITIRSKDYSSWTKDQQIAEDFASKLFVGGRIHKKYNGFVVKAVISPNDMLCDPSKVKGILSSDVKEEKEIIIKPSTVKAYVHSVIRQKSEEPEDVIKYNKLKSPSYHFKKAIEFFEANNKEEEAGDNASSYLSLTKEYGEPAWGKKLAKENLMEAIKDWAMYGGHKKKKLVNLMLDGKYNPDYTFRTKKK